MARSVNTYMIFLFVIIFLCHVAKGLYAALFKTTLPDLRDRLGTATDEVTFAYSFKELGRLVGGVVSGVATDRFQGQSKLFLAAALMMLGASTAAVPWSPNLPLLGIFFVIQGICHGSMDSVSVSMIASIWGARADPPLQAVYFAFSAGSSISPLIASPFLSPDEEPYNCTTSETSVSPGCPEMSATTAAEGIFSEGSRIEIPYAIIGCFAVFIGLVFVVIHCVGTPVSIQLHSPKKESLKQVFSPGSCSGGRAGLGSALVTLLVCHFICLKGSMEGYSILSFTFATENDLNFNKQDASLMEFTKGICNLASRAVVIPLSHFVKPNFILFFTVLGVAAASGLLTFVGTQSQALFWTFSCMFSFFSGPAWGTAYSFINKYIILYALVVALASLGAGLSGFAFNALNGFLYENTIPESFLYLGFAMGLLWILNTVIMYVLANRLGYRHGKGEENQEEVIKVKDSSNSTVCVQNNDAFSNTDKGKMNNLASIPNGEVTRF